MQPLTTADVQHAIDQLGIDTEIITFDSSTATSQLAADNIGCELGQIVKSLAFVINKEKTVVILTSGDQTVDDRKLAKMFEVGRKKVKMAKPDECISTLGYAPGGVPPVGHRTANLPIYIDESLKRYEIVYAAAGTANTIFPIQLNTLAQATNGQFANVMKE